MRSPISASNGATLGKNNNGTALRSSIFHWRVVVKIHDNAETTLFVIKMLKWGGKEVTRKVVLAIFHTGNEGGKQLLGNGGIMQSGR